jgi:hypothetical protein
MADEGVLRDPRRVSGVFYGWVAGSKKVDKASFKSGVVIGPKNPNWGLSEFDAFERMPGLQLLVEPSLFPSLTAGDPND